MKKAKPNKENISSVESPPLTDEELSRMRPVREMLPDIPRFIKVRGKQKAPTKKQIHIRLNPEIVDYFKSQGRGWQTKINEVLTEYVSSRT
jgi:uncharacterized protein (DUF4415 family)